jgi:DNA-binding transcriptional ArsR family regulator
MSETIDLLSVEPEILRALGNPIRRDVVRSMLEEQTPLSPVSIATGLGRPLGNVSYHMGILLKAGVIEMHSTRPVRGALEHFYVLTGAFDA